MVMVLETGRSSWTAPLDAQRLAPGTDLTAVTATQIRDLAGRLIAAWEWHEGDPEILVVPDIGYDGPRTAWLLAELPVQILVRLRSDRVFRRPAPPYVHNPKGGRSARHGGEFVFGDSATWDRKMSEHKPGQGFTGARPRWRGIGSTRGCNAARHGSNTTGRCRSSKAP